MQSRTVICDTDLCRLSLSRHIVSSAVKVTTSRTRKSNVLSTWWLLSTQASEDDRFLRVSKNYFGVQYTTSIDSTNTPSLEWNCSFVRLASECVGAWGSMIQTVEFVLVWEDVMQWLQMSDRYRLEFPPFPRRKTLRYERSWKSGDWLIYFKFHDCPTFSGRDIGLKRVIRVAGP